MHIGWQFPRCLCQLSNEPKYGYLSEVRLAIKCAMIFKLILTIYLTNFKWGSLGLPISKKIFAEIFPQKYMKLARSQERAKRQFWWFINDRYY